MRNERNETWQPNRIKSNQKPAEAPGLEKALGLAELVESPRLPELSGANWERGEPCNVERGVDRRGDCVVVTQSTQALYYSP